MVLFQYLPERGVLGYPFGVKIALPAIPLLAVIAQHAIQGGGFQHFFGGYAQDHAR